MKFKGKKIPAPKPLYAVIPRDEEDIVFKIMPVVNLDDFDKLCPVPEPVRVIKPDGSSYIDYDDPQYKERVDKYAELQSAYIFIKCISETDYLEWDKVKINDPTTWLHWQDELKDSGLTKAEITYLMREVTNANIIDENRIKEARDRFFSKKQATQ